MSTVLDEDTFVLDETILDETLSCDVKPVFLRELLKPGSHLECIKCGASDGGNPFSLISVTEI